MNGSEGIAVGMATKIPPHNLCEIVTGLIALLENPETTTEELTQEYIQGPDFPTSGYIMGTDGIKSAYSTGRGRVIMRGRATIEELDSGKERIIITELPYQVNKANLVEKIADLVRDKVVDGITDLRDESDRQGMRIVIELRRGEVPEVVLNNLYKHTSLQTSFGIIMLAIVGGRPRVLSLLDLVEHFVEFRRGDHNVDGKVDLAPEALAETIAALQPPQQPGGHPFLLDTVSWTADSIPAWARAQKRPAVAVHPSHGFTDGQQVCIVTPHGQLERNVRLDDSLRPDTIQTPYLDASCLVDATNLDPHTATPQRTGIPARLEPAG